MANGILHTTLTVPDAQLHVRGYAESLDGEHMSDTQQQNLQAMLEQLGIEDPRLRMLAEFWCRQNQNSQATEKSEEGEDRKAILAKLGRLARKTSQLQEEAEYLHQRLDLLAAGLGACADCWGEDEMCPNCEGHGRSGYFSPDRNMFMEYVLPAVRTVHRTLGKMSPSPQKPEMHAQTSEHAHQN